MQSLVLAAGMSTRLAALTGGAPKPLTPVGGIPVLHRNLRWMAQHGIAQTYINTHHRGEEVRRSVGDGSAFGLKVNWSEETTLLGTAGGVKRLERELCTDKTFLVVYGDNIFGFDLGKLIGEHQAHSALATIAVFDPAKNPNTGIAGGRVASDASGRITGFVEGRPEAPGYVNAGVYVCETAILDHVSPAPNVSDWARDIFPKLVAGGRELRSHVIDGYCLGIDTPEAYRTAEQMFADGSVK